MNRNAIRKIYLLALAILLASAGTLYAGKKPKITRHDATLLQNAIKITVEWQAEKPVVLLKATVGGESKEVELDEFDDNTRDRHGFYGEAEVSISLEPYEAFVQKDYIPYIIQIKDDFGRKSELTGRVRVKVQEAEDNYTQEGARYSGETPGKSDDSGKYGTKHIIRDVLDIVKQHTAQTRKGDSDHKRGQESADSKLPVITLLPDPGGNINVTVEVGKEYQDPGYTAVDKDGTDIKDKVIVFEKVDTNIAREYIVYYEIYDDEILVAQQVRYVSVVDSTAPVIELKGANPVTIFVGDPYQEYEAIVTDSEGKKIADFNKIETSFWKRKWTDAEEDEPENVEAIATDQAGAYIVVYYYPYNEENFAQAEREVYVEYSDAAPVITLLPEGNPHVRVEVGKQYKDPGYKAVDRDNKNIKDNVKIDGHVNTDIAGEYWVYYDVVDDYGIAAETVYRLVNVVDSTVPDDKGIEPPPPEGRGTFGRITPPGTTKGSKKPPPILRWKGPPTASRTQVTPPKIPPDGISLKPGLAPPPKKKTRVYYKAKLPPPGSTVNKAGSPKLPPGGISLKPGMAQQPATKPSDDQKKPDVRNMQIQR